MDSQLGKIYSGMLYKVWLWVLAKLIMTVMFSNIYLLHPMEDSIKQQNTFTTIAAINVDVIAGYRGYNE